MAAKTFKEAFNESMEKEPWLGKYIHLCKVLSESGASLGEINTIFNEYMIKKEDYDSHEKGELIEYLAKIAKVSKD